jgi:hypothetical protein
MNPVPVRRVIQSLRLLEANEEFQSWIGNTDERMRCITGLNGIVNVGYILNVYHWARQRLAAEIAQTPPFDSASPQQLPTERWRIVEGDNFGGDYPNEQFVSVPATTRAKAQMIADAINAAFCTDDHATRYWRAVPEDYTLKPGFEP